jgi:hypothetical protein
MSALFLAAHGCDTPGLHDCRRFDTAPAIRAATGRLLTDSGFFMLNFRSTNDRHRIEGPLAHVSMPSLFGYFVLLVP